MKRFAPFFLLFCATALVVACGGDDDDSPSSTGSSTGGSTTTTTTVNSNQNTGTVAEYSRLELPHLHGGSNDTVLVHKLSDGTVNYIVEWDYGKKSQRWSAYILNSDLLKQNTTRYTSDTDQYPDDPLIPTSMQWESDPYTGNGQSFQHGHICPSADRLTSYEANYQTFFMTNMQPQFSVFNGGLWATMEAKVRTIAKTCDTLYVCKGGTIDSGTYGGYNRVWRTLDNGLLVPRYFFMALLRVNSGKYSAIGLWTDQISNGSDDGTNLAQYAVTIDELEERTGIDFFCNLPDVTEISVESDYGTTGGWSL